MANVKIHKCLPRILCHLLPFQRYTKFVYVLSSKSRSRLPSIILSIMSFDGECQNLQISSAHFCVSSYIFRIKKYVYLEKIGQGRGKNFCQLHQSMDKCRNLQTSFLHFLFAKVWPVRTIVADTQTDRKTHTHTRKRTCVKSPNVMKTNACTNLLDYTSVDLSLNE